MIKRFQRWLAYRRYIRKTTHIVQYVIQNGAYATEPDLTEWYYNGLETLIEVSNREFTEYHG